MNQTSTSPPATLIIGAGLAGACTAHALAEAGQKVLVLDSATQPAQGGASALPVGLMAQRKNAKAARSSDGICWDADGMPATRALLEKLTEQGLLEQGRDWQACGTWSVDKTSGQAQFQPDACWIKPAALVRACLRHPNIIFAGGQRVVGIAQQDGLWFVSTADSAREDMPQTFAAARCVICAGVGSIALLAMLPADVQAAIAQQKISLNATAGQAIMGPWLPEYAMHLADAAHGNHACNGNGHFVPAVPVRDAADNHQIDSCLRSNYLPERPFLSQNYWLSGATYVHGIKTAQGITPPTAQDADTAQGQAENIARLAELLPAFAPTLHAQAAAEQIHTFAGVRCTTPTRLPIVRELAPGLWLNAGLGSRGLSYAALAGEWLASEDKSM